MARENFPVASRLLPGRRREQLVAIYGFARFCDQIGDDYDGDRTAALDWLERETASALRDPEGAHPLVGPAARVVNDAGADPDDLFRLIEANRMDQEVISYQTFDDLRHYCSLSAMPVGRLVLACFDVGTPEAATLSDRICTGLQLAEHWQDVAEDVGAGRVYVPAADLKRFGLEAGDLLASPPTAEARALVAFEVWRARCELDAGQPLVRLLRGALRLAVAAFWAGGHAALDGIAARNFDVSHPPSRTGRLSVARLALGATIRERR